MLNVKFKQEVLAKISALKHADTNMLTERVSNWANNNSPKGWGAEAGRKHRIEREKPDLSREKNQGASHGTESKCWKSQSISFIARTQWKVDNALDWRQPQKEADAESMARVGQDGQGKWRWKTQCEILWWILQKRPADEVNATLEAVLLDLR